MSSFSAGEQRWIDGLTNLRNVVRQEVIARQVASIAPPGTTVLDVGCGQGTQALRLASSGCTVTGVDPSARLLERCAESARAQRLDIELLNGRIEDLSETCGDRTFDLVCCHGVMMYLDDWSRALASLGQRMRADGRLSVTFRNGHALAMRPGLRGDWSAALAAFDSKAYVNGLGVEARASSVDDIDAALDAAGLRPVSWHGVRVLTDAVAGEVSPPEPETLELLLLAEERAGATAPYKWMASQLHVIATSAGTLRRHRRYGRESGKYPGTEAWGVSR